jgi:hypothetical protein
VSADIDTAYAELLRTGFCSGEPTDRERLLRDEAEMSGWREQVVAPWFVAIREQAKQDGLQVMTYEGNDYLGYDRAPSARLLSPSGAEFTWEFAPGGVWRRDRHEQTMLAEWGETLRDARARRGVEPPNWPDSSGLKLSRPAWPFRLLASLLWWR